MLNTLSLIQNFIIYKIYDSYAKETIEWNKK
jgi:hypothetical protein